MAVVSKTKQTCLFIIIVFQRIPLSTKTSCSTPIHTCLAKQASKEKMLKVKSMQRSGQSESKSSPQNQNGKYLILQIVKIQREHMVNRVSSYFQKYPNRTKNNMNTRKMKRHRNSDTKTSKREPQQNYRLGRVSNDFGGGGGGGGLS